MIYGIMRERLTSPGLLAGLGVWGASLGLYLATLGQTLTWGYRNVGVDGGELLAAANTLGVPHPPGYPTYTLLLKLFATVVPIGDFAFRGNLLSAVLASLSVALLYWVILRFCRYLKPEAPREVWIASAALGALVFGASPLLWSQAVMTEVYTLNALFVGTLLLIASHLALRRPEEKEQEAPSTTAKLALFGLLLGLGMGNHLTLLAVAVPLLFWLWRAVGLRRLASPWTLGAFILGLSIYVYLPIRAAQDPPVNWGDADTFGRFAWMVSAQVYQDYVFGVPVGSLASRAVDWLDLVFSQFNPLGLFLGLVGAAALRTANLRFLAASLVSIAVLMVYSITYNTVDSEVLTIPAFMLFSVWVGVGFLLTVSSVATWLQGARESLPLRGVRMAASQPLILLGVIAFGALPLTSVILNYSSQNLRGDDTAFEYAREVMNTVPDGSVVLSTEEDRAFSLWYMRYVEETDRDVATVAVPLLDFDWYWRSIQKRFPDRIPPEVPADLAEGVKSIVEHNGGRARVFFTYWGPFLDENFKLDIVELGAVGQLLEARVKASP